MPTMISPLVRHGLWTVAVAALACAALWFALSGRNEAVLDRITLYYLPEDTVTANQDLLIAWDQARQVPRSIDLPDGRRAWPVFHLAALPLVEGRPLLFPMILTDEGGRRTPPIPGLGRPLKGSELLAAVPWLSEETQRQFAEFAAGRTGE